MTSRATALSALIGLAGMMPPTAQGFPSIEWGSPRKRGKASKDTKARRRRVKNARRRNR